MNYHYSVLTALLGLGLIMGLVLLGFLLYHIQMAMSNRTTNEVDKYHTYRRLGGELFHNREAEKRRERERELQRTNSKQKTQQRDQLPQPKVFFYLLLLLFFRGHKKINDTSQKYKKKKESKMLFPSWATRGVLVRVDAISKHNGEGGLIYVYAKLMSRHTHTYKYTFQYIEAGQ